jgi:hypothetical protein
MVVLGELMPPSPFRRVKADENIDAKGRLAYTFTARAGVLKLADKIDSNSIAREGVWVQLPPPA